MDKESITIVVAGIVTILGILIPGIVSIITALRTEKAVQAVALVNEKQSGKLEGIGVQLDGQRTEMLSRIATLEGLLSKNSGDSDRADGADLALANHKHAAVVAAKKEEKENEKG